MTTIPANGQSSAMTCVSVPVLRVTLACDKAERFEPIEDHGHCRQGRTIGIDQRILDAEPKEARPTDIAIVESA